MFRSIWSIGTWPGPSIITWQFRCRARAAELAHHLQFGELRFIAGVGDRPRPQPVADAPGHVVLVHDVAQVVEVREERVFPGRGPSSTSPPASRRG